MWHCDCLATHQQRRVLPRVRVCVQQAEQVSYGPCREVHDLEAQAASGTQKIHANNAAPHTAVYVSHTALQPISRRATTFRSSSQTATWRACTRCVCVCIMQYTPNVTHVPPTHPLHAKTILFGAGQAARLFRGLLAGHCQGSVQHQDLGQPPR